jgi:hypothetical protein
VPSLGACREGSDCCGSPVNATCTAEQCCLYGGQPCTSGSECCSGRCSGSGFCG